MLEIPGIIYNEAWRAQARWNAGNHFPLAGGKRCQCLPRNIAGTI